MPLLPQGIGPRINLSRVAFAIVLGLAMAGVVTFGFRQTQDNATSQSERGLQLFGAQTIQSFSQQVADQANQSGARSLELRGAYGARGRRPQAVQRRSLGRQPAGRRRRWCRAGHGQHSRSGVDPRKRRHGGGPSRPRGNHVPGCGRARHPDDWRAGGAIHGDVLRRNFWSDALLRDGCNARDCLRDRRPDVARFPADIAGFRPHAQERLALASHGCGRRARDHRGDAGLRRRQCIAVRSHWSSARASS